MLFNKNGFKFISISIFIASLALTGCSYLPWNDDKEDEDLFFEEDFGSEFENVPSDDKGKEAQNTEDDFFKDDNQMLNPNR